MNRQSAQAYYRREMLKMRDELEELRRFKADVLALEPVAYGQMNVLLNAADRVLFMACEKQSANSFHDSYYDLTDLYDLKGLK